MTAAMIERASECEMRVSFTLPWPPSMNHYWMTKRRGPGAGRVYLSEAGKAYRKAGLEAIAEQHIPVIRGIQSVRLTIFATSPQFDKNGKRRGGRAARPDLDNALKASIDVLEHSGLLLDDNLIDDLRIIRCPVAAHPYLHILFEVLACE